MAESTNILQRLDHIIESVNGLECVDVPPSVPTGTNNVDSVNVTADEGGQMKEELGFEVDAYGVEGNVDYDKLLKFWGCDPITPEHLERWTKITGKPPHPMIRRGVYYAHRDLDVILDCAEKGEPFFLYTGRGPSSTSMHVGHMVPFIINKHMQDVFGCPLVVQITEDEKFFWKDMTLEQSYSRARENIRDIISFGFDITKTFIFSDLDYAQYLRPNVCRVQKKVTVNKLCKIFGFTDMSKINVGQLAYPAVQAVPAFSSTFPVHFRKQKLRCIIPCAIDQDPYFRMTRDIADSLGEFKCSTLYAKFIPDLSGPGKMSASTGVAIFLNDPKKVMIKKINKAFSGGQDDEEQHRKIGANLDIDIPYQYLRFFYEDDEDLARIAKEYGAGNMLTGEVKNKLKDVLIPLVQEIQENRKHVTDEVIDAFMSIRPLQF